MKNYDSIVIGGGMIGAASALGLARLGQRVLVVEACPPVAYQASQAIDLRVSALSHQSIALLERLGAWQAVEAMRHAPYRSLQAWENPEQVLSFEADDVGLENLGSIVENRVIQLALWDQLEAFNVEFVQSDSSKLVSISEHDCQILLGEQQVKAKRLLVADGALSSMRSQLGIATSGWNYRQHCLLINIELDAPQQTTTWQQFNPSGPRALLPLPGQKAALVWYDTPAQIKTLKALSSAALKLTIKEQFPQLPGNFEISNFASFPLTRMHAKSYVKDCAVLLGDAAHTIHPMAGQGVNLGFKDVEALLESIAEHGKSVDNFALANYQRQRRRDNLLMQSMMDGFYLGFSNDNPLAKGLRKVGLNLAQKSGPLKLVALRYALGLAPL
ncbi:FAD-dependent oxidoreductase [Alginatibacterium sediminis]|uniref:FAD-dependent oxidoreductase n=1 Tax=Alginatibacterium sediminis TaxID=2164068 RepID=A0A420E5G5_9ALTE|nr:FAD-dependent oxidoreductase [Alginatibacterium sediminis]RKF12748.1 FAD-dependent oxidoreductase [Alginatibacterium sediminis]